MSKRLGGIKGCILLYDRGFFLPLAQHIFSWTFVPIKVVTNESPFESQCVCVCLCVFSSHLFWTSGLLVDVPAGVTQEKGYTGFLIHLPSAVPALFFLARRIQPFLPLVDREVEFCVLTN